MGRKENTDMAKYTVKYACGHEGQVQLFGPGESRDWRLAKLADEQCPDCRRKAFAALRDAGDLRISDWFARKEGVPSSVQNFPTVAKETEKAVLVSGPGFEDWVPMTAFESRSAYCGIRWKAMLDSYSAEWLDGYEYIMAFAEKCGLGAVRGLHPRDIFAILAQRGHTPEEFRRFCSEAGR